MDNKDHEVVLDILEYYSEMQDSVSDALFSLLDDFHYDVDRNFIGECECVLRLRHDHSWFPTRLEEMRDNGERKLHESERTKTFHVLISELLGEKRQIQESWFSDDEKEKLTIVFGIEPILAGRNYIRLRFTQRSRKIETVVDKKWRRQE
jgi:hypothetical protein